MYQLHKNCTKTEKFGNDSKKLIFFDNEVDNGLSLQKAYYIVFPTTLFIYFLYNNVIKKNLILFVFIGVILGLSPYRKV